MLFKHLYKNEKQLFEGVHLLKISENYLWRNQSVMKLRDAHLQVNKKKVPSQILFHVFCLHFLIIHLLLKRLWKCASTIPFRKYKWKVVPPVIYQSITIHLSQLSSCRNGIWRSLEYSFCQIDWNSSFLATIKITRTSFLPWVLICTFL